MDAWSFYLEAFEGTYEEGRKKDVDGAEVDPFFGATLTMLFLFKDKGTEGDDDDGVVEGSDNEGWYSDWLLISLVTASANPDMTHSRDGYRQYSSLALIHVIAIPLAMPEAYTTVGLRRRAGRTRVCH